VCFLENGLRNHTRKKNNLQRVAFLEGVPLGRTTTPLKN